MYPKILAAAGTAAAVLGIGTAALAGTSGNPTPPGSGSASGRAAQHAHQGHRHQLHRLLRHVLHGAVTTKGADGYVTHSAVRGSVTAVSPTSITVKAADGFTETFALGADTRVRERTAGTSGAKSGTVSDVKSGDAVAVIGKAPEHSSADPLARVIVDGLRR